MNKCVLQDKNKEVVTLRAEMQRQKTEGDEECRRLHALVTSLKHRLASQDQQIATLKEDSGHMHALKQEVEALKTGLKYENVEAAPSGHNAGACEGDRGDWLTRQHPAGPPPETSSAIAMGDRPRQPTRVNSFPLSLDYNDSDGGGQAALRGMTGAPLRVDLGNHPHPRTSSAQGKFPNLKTGSVLSRSPSPTKRPLPSSSRTARPRSQPELFQDLDPFV